MERILIVDSDPFFRDVFSGLLRHEGYSTDTAASGAEAFAKLQGGDYQVVVTELVLPDVTGLDILSRVKEHDRSIEVVVATGHANVETAIQALKNGARDYLVKPVNHDEFRHSVSVSLEQRRLLDENQELKRLVSLFQASQAIANCLDVERIGEMVVSALSRETGVERGLAFFPDDEGYLSLKGLKELDEAAGRALAELVAAAFGRRSAKSDPILFLRDFLPQDDHLAPARQADLREALLLAVRTKGKLLGVVALFNDRGKTLPSDVERKNLNFLLDQSSLAFENAVRYTTARNLVNIDEVTGLFNYRYLETALDREIKRAERYRSSLSVVFLDIDQFKDVNDTHGHLIGSSVLREVGALIKRLVREVDTVIRYGGDEYTIILVESTNVGAASASERVRKAVEEHVFMAEEGYNIRLTASLGYACYPDDSTSYRELLEMADQAMYKGKFSGKNVVFHIGQQTGGDNEQGE
ncbi:diguanylate cyclase [Geobacter sp. DSM 9736]|uniref:diguanylate cyclase n=1 Tax=Geobacter sp. DSM 9736 TaxID=1277350 RepID=UPI000B5032B8|nr:diguanylate cyclase [Geobacter sp. DSM 9736]SNB45314.1 response regulator receiver modulated diguanylate cyclase [Geobacter sp. DSM 9736]